MYIYRRRELQYCLDTNARNPHIASIHLLTERFVNVSVNVDGYTGEGVYVEGVNSYKIII